jgi:hypothetical protein
MRAAMEIRIIHSTILILISNSTDPILWSGGNICPDQRFFWFGRKAERVQQPTDRLTMAEI